MDWTTRSWCCPAGITPPAKRHSSLWTAGRLRRFCGPRSIASNRAAGKHILIPRVTIKPRLMSQGAGNTIEERRGEFLLSTDRDRLDLDVIHGFLTSSYWAKGIPREIVVRSIQHSLCFGVYKQAQQVGFARV